MALIVLGSMLLKEPVQVNQQANHGTLGNDYTVRQMLASKEAYMLFVIFFAACMSGLYLIGIVKDMGVQLAGMDLAHRRQHRFCRGNLQYRRPHHSGHPVR
ncbi:Inner membrane protein yhjX [Serratia fonticola]|uniref:Inner membrane protein yhjX n=1 Tax=Serratia fonticola TaxID=47917 RepID=A0A4V6KPD5_SERFO|nr:Inner membrane protein yhjX [Serratia fonticola]